MQIFQSDLTGDGTDGDILPGTNLGSFGRSVTPKNINQYIANYDTKYANLPTPAGQALISGQLFTQTNFNSWVPSRRIWPWLLPEKWGWAACFTPIWA